MMDTSREIKYSTIQSLETHPHLSLQSWSKYILLLLLFKNSFFKSSIYECLLIAGI